MTITCRKFEGQEDYLRLKEFLEESISVSGPKFYFNLNSLEFGNDLFENASYSDAVAKGLGNTFLWFEDDKLMGGIMVDQRVQLMINPKDKHRFNEMFKAAEEVVDKQIREGREDLGIKAFRECIWRPFDEDMDIENVLKENDYYKTEEYWVLRCFDHREVVEASNLPNGYYIKQISEISDLSKVIELYDQCLGMGFDEISLRKAKDSSAYRSELDIVVMSPDHIPVALCSGRYDEKNKMASFEAVACFKEHRKKGICKAMMLYALKAAKDLGAETSTVFTLTPDKFPAPNRLYETVGFKLVGNRYSWKSKVL